MRLIDIITAPWAITPEKLLEIRGIYETHLRGEKIDLKPIEAALGRPLDNRSQGYEVVDGVAVIPVDGVIAKRMNLFTQISGGVSTDLLARDFRAALEDPEVESIVLDIDSPGGTVDGTVDIARLIFESRGTKPIIAFTDGMMASAAYWIGSAADKVYIGNDATSVGSIGVVATHQDVSKAQEMAGVKTTEVYAGRYKRVASQYTPLSDEGRATIQERVDYIYSVFVNAVAAQRGISEKEAIAMADGRIFTGEQAIEAGLVDGVSTLDAVIATINNERKEKSMAKEEAKEAVETPAITAEYIAESHKDVFDAIKALGYGEGKLAGTEEGAKAERERIQGVFSLYRPGREKVVSERMFDGKSTKADASVAILEAEDARRDALRKDHAEDGSEVKVDQVEPGDMSAVSNDKKITELVAAYRKENGCDEKTALLAVSREHPELFRERR
ncbi:MAG: signal peptide peptidase SppA [Thermodesulfobacteriota bacterium]